MAITDHKISQGEIDGKHVQSAPDVLSKVPADNKAVFDNLVEYFIGKYNDLIDEVNSDYVSLGGIGSGLALDDTTVRWRYSISKGTSIGLNYSGSITPLSPSGYSTMVGSISGLEKNDFMNCYLEINGTDYECDDAFETGDYITTGCMINSVKVNIQYQSSSGDITISSASNPLDTTYWNVSIYRAVAEKVPRKSLPGEEQLDYQTMIDMFYPVGSYYETSDTSFDPNVRWGGTWVLETAGQVHVSGGTGYTVSKANNNSGKGASDGGSADAIVPYHRHSISITSQAGGNHKHGVNNNAGYFVYSDVSEAHNSTVQYSSSGTLKIDGLQNQSGNNVFHHTQYTANENAHKHSVSGNSEYVGTSGNTTNANMQPYINVNRWHRTA